MIVMTYPRNETYFKKIHTHYAMLQFDSSYNFVVGTYISVNISVRDQCQTKVELHILFALHWNLFRL